jgi:tRNA A58 N-methylase Trm61
MFPPRPTHLLHMLLREVIRAGDRVVDATAGNGHDTVFLAEAVGEKGKVISVDIQVAAIEATRQRVIEKQLEDRVELYQASHAEIGKWSEKGSVAAVVFNLGYLPGADHALITRTETTLLALEGALDVLKVGGVLAVICYPGHAGGDVEAEKVEGFLRMLENFRLAKYELLSTVRASPFLLIAMKKSD